MLRRRCLACGRTFRPMPQVPDQVYCSDPACQRLRRRLWQRQKRLEDPAYRENEVRAHQQWLERNKDYWRKYRQMHPDYTDDNRQRQRLRNATRSGAAIANVDLSQAAPDLLTGTYRLIRLDGGVANKDEWIVRLTVVST